MEYNELKALPLKDVVALTNNKQVKVLAAIHWEDVSFKDIFYASVTDPLALYNVMDQVLKKINS